jgi:hypothetical protein
MLIFSVINTLLDQSFFASEKKTPPALPIGLKVLVAPLESIGF